VALINSNRQKLYYDKNTEPGFVAFYDIRPGNGAGLFLFLFTGPKLSRVCTEKNPFATLTHDKTCPVSSGILIIAECYWQMCTGIPGTETGSLKGTKDL